jgi:peptide deformylase
MSATYKDIIALPHKNLRKRSTKVGLINDETLALAKRMQEATLSWESKREHEVGVALAATQINELKKMVIIRNNFDDKSDKTFNVLVNPVITKREGPIVEDFEGCLSIKDIYGKVPRYSKVKVKAQDLNGREVRITAEGFLARIFQHEIDHTKGVMFIDHIKDESDAFYTLKPDGKLEKLDYGKQIKSNSLLW